MIFNQGWWFKTKDKTQQQQQLLSWPKSMSILSRHTVNELFFWILCATTTPFHPSWRFPVLKNKIKTQVCGGQLLIIGNMQQFVKSQLKPVLVKDFQHYVQLPMGNTLKEIKVALKMMMMMIVNCFTQSISLLYTFTHKQRIQIERKSNFHCRIW